MANELSVVLSVPTHLNQDGLTVRMAGTADAPLFCLADVCRVLEIRNVPQVAEWLEADEKGICQTDTPGGPQQATFVTEPGLYRAIMRSGKPAAKEFSRWVCHDVLPCIRKHGCYPVPASSHEPTQGELLLAAVQHLVEVERRQLTQEGKLSEMCQDLAAVRDQASDAQHVAQAAMHTADCNHGFFSVLGYARRHGWEMPIKLAAAHGKRLAAECRGQGIDIPRVADPRFGVVNIYPESVLQEYFARHSPDRE